MNDSSESSTVIIVDDEFAVRDALRLVIEHMGHEVHCFESASDFLEFLRANSPSGPFCLVVDIQMPQIDGLELIQQIEELRSELRIVAMTGHGEAELKERSEKLGADAFLEKPFRPTEFQDTIEALLRLPRSG